MKKNILILLFFIGLVSQTIAQEFHIRREKDKVGVQNNNGNWLINPIYQDIVPYFAERQYYLLFLEKGEDFQEDGTFLETDTLGMPLFGSSQFLVADEEFYVMSITEYNTLRHEVDHEKSDFCIVFLKHKEGEDYINVNKNMLIHMGYVSSFEQKIRNHFIVENSGQFGLYSIQKEFFLLETFYDEILIPQDMLVVNSEEILDTTTYNPFEKRVIVKRRGKSGIYNYETDDWEIDMERGEIVAVLDPECSKVVIKDGETQTLYVNGLPRTSASEYLFSPEQEYVKGYNKKYLYSKNQIAGTYEITDWFGNKIIEKETEILMYNDQFFGLPSFNGTVNVYSFSNSRKKIFNADKVLIDKESVDEVFPSLYSYIDKKFLVVKKREQYGILLPNGIIVMGINNLDVSVDHLSYSSKGVYGIIDLTSMKVINIQSSTPIKVNFDYGIYQNVYTFIDNEGVELQRTHQGKKVKLANSKWEPKKFKDGWNMVLLDKKSPILNQYYKSIKKNYNTNFLMALVENEYGWGVCNFASEIIVPLKYEDIYMEFNSSGNPVFFVKENGKWGLYNHEGTLTVPTNYSQINLLPEAIPDYDGDYIQCTSEEDGIEFYSVDGKLLFSEDFDITKCIINSTYVQELGDFMPTISCTNDRGLTRTIIMNDSDDHLFSEINYISRFENYVMTEKNDSLRIHNIYGSLISIHYFEKESEIIENLVVSKTNGGCQLYDFNGRQIGKDNYSSAEKKDEYFLKVVQNDGSVSFISFTDHQEQSLEEWTKKFQTSQNQ